MMKANVTFIPRDGMPDGNGRKNMYKQKYSHLMAAELEGKRGTGSHNSLQG